jgi:predicted nucleic acid-binding protein
MCGGCAKAGNESGMSRVFWDTNLFIYLVEDRGRLAERVATLAVRMRARNDQLFTSSLALGEVLVKPTSLGDSKLAEVYEDLIARHAVIVPFDESAARLYAAIRVDRTVKAPDAIQLACAAKAQADLFITNDERLSQKTVRGIQFIVSLARAPL